MLAATALADPTTPGAVAALVRVPSGAAIVPPLTAALTDPAPLVRATAARVVAVRNAKVLIPVLRTAAEHETDSSAAREQLCAIVLLGADDDIAFAEAVSAKLPASIDDAMALSIARRGGKQAIDMYVSTVARSRAVNHPEFFRVALWGHSELATYAASRVLTSRNAGGWRGLLATLRDSSVTLSPAMMMVGVTDADEALRYESMRHLLLVYAPEPETLGEPLRAALLAPRAEQSSTREDFAHELLRRMLGAERKDDKRWIDWLETAEADDVLPNKDAGLLQYLTDAEYTVRHNRCGLQPTACDLPAKRPTGRALPMTEVDAPAFTLPDVLPAGLTHAVITETKCREQWLGVIPVSLDAAGRVQLLSLDGVTDSGRCRVALEELLRLSFATNESIKSPKAGQVLVVKADGTEPCLDWSRPENLNSSRLLRAGGSTKDPIAKKRVEPIFPADARRKMGNAGAVRSPLILQMIITKEGCIRNIRFRTQTPVATLNGAAALAASQWTFVPGYLGDQPIDVFFNLTVNYSLK
jgi:hypothetical protein